MKEFAELTATISILGVQLSKATKERNAWKREAQKLARLFGDIGKQQKERKKPTTKYREVMK